MATVKIAPLGQQDVTRVFAMTDVEFPEETRSDLYAYLAFCLTTDKKFVRAAHAVKKTFNIQVWANKKYSPF